MFAPDLSQSKNIKKDEVIQIPVGDNTTLTWGDMNTLNWKINGVFITIFVWLLLQAWESYKKSKDDTKERLERIEKALERISARLDHTPTFKDLHNPNFPRPT